MEYYLGAISSCALILWLNKRLNLKKLLLESLLICMIIYLFRLIGSFIKDKFNIPLSPFDYLPEVVNLWIGGLIFFSIACTLSVQAWRHSGKNKG